MKENWADKTRKKLAEHRKTPPAGLWEGISQQIASVPSEPAVRLVPSRHWWWKVAAAVFLLLVGFTALYHRPDKHEQVKRPVASATQQPPMAAKVMPHAERPPMAFAPPQSPRKNVSVGENSPSATQDSIPNQPEPACNEESAHNAQHSLQAKRPFGHSETPNVQRSTANVQRPQAKESRWSLGLNASGSLLTANSERSGHSYPIPPIYQDETANGSGEVPPMKYLADHHFPMRFGLSLHYQLNPNLALVSGINYTYLYSHFSIPYYQDISIDQKLHYVGLPVGLAWKLWSGRRLQVYVSGGTMLEKCVNDEPWQWSLNGAVGAEYVASRRVGFYLEPSLGYYFDDGTQLEHYYKEHPLAPSIELGVRLHF